MFIATSQFINTAKHKHQLEDRLWTRPWTGLWMGLSIRNPYFKRMPL